MIIFSISNKQLLYPAVDMKTGSIYQYRVNKRSKQEKVRAVS